MWSSRRAKAVRETLSLFTRPRSWFDSDLVKTAEGRIGHDSHWSASVHCIVYMVLGTYIPWTRLPQHSSCLLYKVSGCGSPMSGLYSLEDQTNTLAINISAIPITLISVLYDSSIHIGDTTSNHSKLYFGICAALLSISITRTTQITLIHQADAQISFPQFLKTTPNPYHLPPKMATGTIQ